MLPHKKEGKKGALPSGREFMRQDMGKEEVEVKKKFVMIAMISLLIGGVSIPGCTNAPAPESQALASVEEVNLEDGSETFSAQGDEVQVKPVMKEKTPVVEDLSESTEETLDTNLSKGRDEAFTESGEEIVVEISKSSEQPSADLPETDGTEEESETSAEGEKEEALTPMDDRDMYAMQEVNLREGPGTKYQTCGRLRRGDAVTVCGTTQDGWYLLKTGQFVFGRYLGGEPPVMESGVSLQGSSESIDGAGEGNESEEYVASADEFLRRVNEQRTALGLSVLIKDDAMTEYAKKRAVEIASCFSHDGFSGYSGENIGNFSSGDAGAWYEAFYKSQGHKENMMDAFYEKTGAAVYFNGREYYVVQVFQYGTASYEQAQQAADDMQGADLLPAGGSDGGMTQSYSTTGESVSPGDEGYDELSAAAQALLDAWNAGGGN